ncbi:MAG: flippase [Chloroflexi bacterium]|nr:MAG: flippase [Chloroflexota bacterium]MBL1192829.1 flippase [Chloroflexota bacterium]NOH10122.1 flippase [Chloroflexota bacterium]
MLNNILNRSQELFNRVFETEVLRRIVKNSSYLVSASGFTAALGFVQSIFVGRLLGPAGLGLFSAVRSFTGVANRFASFRIHEMVVRHVRLYEESGEHEKGAAVYKIAGLLEMAGAIVAFGIIWSLSGLGARVFGQDPTTAPLFVLYGSVVLINLLFESSTGLLQVFDRFRVMAGITAVQGVFTLAFVVMAFLTQASLNGVVLAYVAGKLLGGVATTVAAFITAGQEWGWSWWRVPLNVLKQDRRRLLTFAFSTNASGTISLIAKDSEALWISGFLGTTQAGFYGVALWLVGILQIPISPLPNTTYPEISREIARKDWKSTRYVLRRGSWLATAYSLPVTVGLIALGWWLIPFVYGEDFAPAYPVLVILLIGYTFTNIFYWNRIALLALNRPVFPTVVNFIGMLLKVAGILLFASRFGALAFAGLLSGYFIFTVGAAAARVLLDLRQREASETPA